MSPPGCEIRACSEADIERIAAIYADSVRRETASFELEPPDSAEMAKRWKALVQQGYPYLVAVEDGEVIGYAYAAPYRPRPAYRHTVENTVYVDPRAHRSGVGRALMERLIEDAAAHGFRQMIAVIGDSAHEASIEFHHSLGFEYIGNIRSVGYKHGKWLDTVLMQRSLGAGDGAPPERA